MAIPLSVPLTRLPTPGPLSRRRPPHSLHVPQKAKRQTLSCNFCMTLRAILPGVTERFSRYFLTGVSIGPVGRWAHALSLKCRAIVSSPQPSPGNGHTEEQRQHTLIRDLF